MAETEIREGVQFEDLDEDVVQKPPRADWLWLVRLAAVVFVIGGWELWGRQVEAVLMSYPSAIVAAAWEMLLRGELANGIGASLLTLAVSFSISLVVGIGLGLLIGRYRTFEAATDWLVNALYATPLVAIIPIVILWFGLGLTAKVVIVTLLAVFPILINTAAGVRNVHPPFMELAAAFAATERQVFTKIILPAALPYVMTGVRLGIGRAIIGMVVAEFFTAINGLGAIIVKYSGQYDTASMFVPIFVLMLLGIILTELAKRAEAYFAPWKATTE
jgi:NitT/TauT family transport system permease protein